MSSNTIKYEYTQGCPNDTIGVLSQQSYKDGKGVLNSAKHAKIVVEHDKTTDFVIRAKRHKAFRENGKIVERKVVTAKGNDELTH